MWVYTGAYNSTHIEPQRPELEPEGRMKLGSVPGCDKLLVGGLATGETASQQRLGDGGDS